MPPPETAFSFLGLLWVLACSCLWWVKFAWHTHWPYLCSLQLHRANPARTTALQRFKEATSSHPQGKHYKCLKLMPKHLSLEPLSQPWSFFLDMLWNQCSESSVKNWGSVYWYKLWNEILKLHCTLKSPGKFVYNAPWGTPPTESGCAVMPKAFYFNQSIQLWEVHRPLFKKHSSKTSHLSRFSLLQMGVKSVFLLDNNVSWDLAPKLVTKYCLNIECTWIMIKWELGIH